MRDFLEDEKLVLDGLAIRRNADVKSCSFHQGTVSCILGGSSKDGAGGMTKFRWNDPPGEADPARVQRDDSRIVLSDTETARLRGLARKKKRNAAKEAAGLKKIGAVRRAAALEKTAALKAARKKEADFQKAVARRKAAVLKAAAPLKQVIAKPSKPASSLTKRSTPSTVKPKPPMTPADVEREALWISMRRLQKKGARPAPIVERVKLPPRKP